METKVGKNAIKSSKLTFSGKHIVYLLGIALLSACAPMRSVSSVQAIETRFVQDNGGVANHAALAKQYENLANEMRSNVQAQQRRLKRRSNAVLFGKNGKHIKALADFKIREFQKAEKQSLAKAHYHRAMAAQPASRKSYMHTNYQQSDKTSQSNDY
ncbi:hypothetical protein SAMN05216302_101523 [Nitrosomonas aestuarii]|uniref:Lipoprotein n=1 Tax=Nitrosomonas aestuarii TaxID=52441 RepID=A0A1I4CDG7_9PROT|nr:hypothetical protein [Nitrosomonas aestuarii]SFK78051.1 hypothetical protein SAMN05216302_101523 [Nitrosomonas aestuarii]